MIVSFGCERFVSPEFEEFVVSSEEGDQSAKLSSSWLCVITLFAGPFAPSVVRFTIDQKVGR
jgi:hypothetical protein